MLSVPQRYLVGLSVDPGREAITASLVRVQGAGLSMRPEVVHALRQVILPYQRETLHEGHGLADACAAGIRQLVQRPGIDLRHVLAIGLYTEAGDSFANSAEAIADKTGVTTLSGLGDRDAASGGNGTLLTPAADCLLAPPDGTPRLLIHLGDVTTVVALPEQPSFSGIIGLEAGPGLLWLRTLAYHGSAGRETDDATGSRAVQGHCLQGVLARWMEHPYFGKRPPKRMPRDLFLHEDELAMTLGTIRSAGGSLNDLLCTATHAIAEAIRAGYQLWIAPHLQISQVYLSGAGTRNGFLWKLLQSQFAEQELFLTERLGIPPLAREASAAAVLTALTLDGVTANLPLLTGAAGGRMIGRWVPGDARNWARVTAWAAEQLQDYRFLSNRAA